MSIPQSTAYTVMLKVFLSSDHVTPATGKTVAVVLSKAGGAFANPSAGATNATEVSNGWYFVSVSTTDTNTLGDLVVRGTVSGCDDSERILPVVKATNGGLTALPDAVAGANGGLAVLSAGATTLAYTISTLTTYTGNTPQTGDAFARLGTPANASIAADIAEVEAETDAIGDPWATAEPGSYSAGTFGNFVVTQLSKLNTAPIVIQTQPGQGNLIVFVRDTDMNAAEGRQIDVPAPSGTDISTATSLLLYVNDALVCTGSYALVGSQQMARFQPTAAQTRGMLPGPLQPWQALAVLLSGRKVNLVAGTSVCNVYGSQEPGD